MGTIFSLIHKWGSKRNIACPGAQGQAVPEAEAESGLPESKTHLLTLSMQKGMGYREEDSNWNWDTQVPEPPSLELSSSLSLGRQKRWGLISSISKLGIKSVPLVGLSENRMI